MAHSGRNDADKSSNFPKICKKLTKKPFKEGFLHRKNRKFQNKLQKGIYKKKSACKINIVTNK